jgi:hypothetical protein
MKKITVGIEHFFVTDDEAEKIGLLIDAKKDGIVELKNGDRISLKNISSIRELSANDKAWDNHGKGVW